MSPNFSVTILAGICVFLANQALLAPVDNTVPKETSKSSSNLEEELKSQSSPSHVVKGQVPQRSANHVIQEPVPPKIDIADQDVLKEDLNEDEMKDIMNKMSIEDILENVLQTFKDHPEILKELTEDEERKTGISVDDDMFKADFQKPPPQLLEMPKMVEKKTGSRYLEEKKKANKWKLKYGGKSSEENFWKQRYGDSSSSSKYDSEEQKPSKSSESDSSEENYWKQRYGGSSSRSSGHDSSSESSSEENNRVEKRVPEELEKSIDLVSMPLEGGEADISTGNKRSNLGSQNQRLLRKYTAWIPQGVFKDPEGKLTSAVDDPFINTLPLFLPGDLPGESKSNDEVGISGNHKNNANALENLAFNGDTIVDSLKEEKNTPKMDAPVKTLDQVMAIEKSVAEKKEKSKLQTDHDSNVTDEDELKALSPRNKEKEEKAKKNHM